MLARKPLSMKPKEPAKTEQISVVGWPDGAAEATNLITAELCKYPDHVQDFILNAVGVNLLGARVRNHFPGVTELKVPGSPGLLQSIREGRKASE